MRLSIQGLVKPVFAIAVAAVMLAAGTGMAMAATTKAPPKPTKAVVKQINADEAVMSKCAQARFEVTKEQVKTIGIEGSAIALGIPLDEATLGFGTPTIVVAEGIFTVADGFALGYEELSAIKTCYPQLFKGNGESRSNIPHPPLPAWLLKALQKDRNRLQGSTSLG